MSRRADVAAANCCATYSYRWIERKPQVLWPGNVDPGAVVEPVVMLAE
jgi:hypothetical protein